MTRQIVLDITHATPFFPRVVLGILLPSRYVSVETNLALIAHREVSEPLSNYKLKARVKQ